MPDWPNYEEPSKTLKLSEIRHVRQVIVATEQLQQ